VKTVPDPGIKSPGRRTAERSLILAGIASAALFVTFHARSSSRGPSSPNKSRVTPMAFRISSTSFADGGDIPKKFTCDGADVSPQLAWSEPPSGTRSLALLADDPDAPGGNWNHWILWNMPAETRHLAEGVSKTAQLPDGSRQGVNDFHKVGYNGPCPPPGKPHRYYFKLLALDARLDLKGNSVKRELEAAIQGHILAQSQWMGRYGR